MKLASIYKFVPIINSADINAGVDGDSINMGKAHRVLFVLMFGTLDGNAVLTVNSGATDGAKTSALTFRYALGSAAVGSASADVLGAQTAVSSLTLTAATYSNKMLIIELEADQMDTNNDEEWLTLSLSDAANSGICHAVAIVEPRYSDGTTVLA
jgi:hypothetical protein